MKKLLTITMVGAVLSAPAIAVQKCVLNLNEIMSWTNETSEYNPDWKLVAYTVDNPFSEDITLRGIATCNNEFGNYGQKLASFYQYTNYGKYCWCKIVSPDAYSTETWVSVQTGDSQQAFSSVDACYRKCASKCAEEFIMGGAF